MFQNDAYVTINIIYLNITTPLTAFQSSATNLQLMLSCKLEAQTSHIIIKTDVATCTRSW